MEKNAKIYVAGHRGMVGSAILRELRRQGYENIITRTHSELDLCRQQQVEDFFAAEKPEYVFLAAAKVGGIVANQEALADFIKEIGLPTTLRELGVDESIDLGIIAASCNVAPGSYGKMCHAEIAAIFSECR